MSLRWSRVLFGAVAASYVVVLAWLAIGVIMLGGGALLARLGTRGVSRPLRRGHLRLGHLVAPRLPAAWALTYCRKHGTP